MEFLSSFVFLHTSHRQKKAQRERALHENCTMQLHKSNPVNCNAELSVESKLWIAVEPTDSVVLSRGWPN